MARRLCDRSSKRILIIDGHPDAAEAAGYTVRVVKLAELEFPWLRSAAEFAGSPPLLEIAQRGE